MIASFEINNKISTLITDNAYNMVNAFSPGLGSNTYFFIKYKYKYIMQDTNTNTNTLFCENQIQIQIQIRIWTQP